MSKSILYIILFLLATSLFAQERNPLVVSKDIETKKISEEKEYDPLAPSRAAFYSAVVPGLGQAYNKKYWKIPIVYAGMATGIYFYLDQDKDYDRFRNAYKRRLAGFTDDEFFGEGDTPTISNQRLIDAQRSASRNKDYSIIATLLVYVLNIIDANVDAHLQQFNVGEDLSLESNFNIQTINSQPNYGLSFKLKLK